MSSWFDQIDLSALDLAGFQDQLVKSVEEVSLTLLLSLIS